MSLSLSAKRILALASIKGFGVKSFHLLLHRMGSVEDIWRASYEDLHASELKSSACRMICDARDRHEREGFASVTSQIENWLAVDRRHFLTIEDSVYPPLLKQIYDAPPYLFLEGNIQALDMPSIAIVGSRKASSSGLKHARHFARELVNHQLSVTSGLALGVDAAAHQGALDENGQTIAVLATGLDVIYPRKHARLAEQIKEEGALVSEMSLGTMPIPANFPRRNRIVSGLSRGVLIVEAGLNSGSLITADFAIEHDREVFVIPGSISNPLSKGGNSLIKQGAHLVEDSSDILSVLSTHYELAPARIAGRSTLSQAFRKPSEVQHSDNPVEDLNAEELRVFELIGYEKRSFDELAENSRMEPFKLTETLMNLELKGVLETVPGGYQRI